ncbi:hypothetical protein PR202_ga29538 [Eleusine coracana subsp. coracana]|uniref:At1g68980-like TPR repeats domain-containing protein n=1 Tax=Eleusine coracana subsp. coracana TaxID=191504 RepID=A0AAV5DJU6_ELECO|nr:hypothetical protein PR202_ga29538 [Eleusine coracana subsp. coracana]
MKDGNVDEAMQSFGDYKRLHGLPEPQVLNSVIVSLSYTCSRRWLLRAFDMVLSVYQVNSNLLNSGSLMRLALALARDQMPVPASTVLRIMLETKMLPDVNMLSMSFMHMVKSQVGSYLAADVLAETCECYLDHVTDRRQLKSFGKSATILYLIPGTEPESGSPKTLMKAMNQKEKILQLDWP